MTGKRLLIVLALLVACKPAQKPVDKGALPRVPATVISIRTAIAGQVTSHEVVIAGSRARNTAELDVWRLYDTKAGTVTFVDEIGRTIRTESVASLRAKRSRTLAAALPAHFPAARLSRGPARQLLGVHTEQHLVEVGAYKRELWLGRHPAVPDDLFGMMVASDNPASPLAPMMRAADQELLRVKGFPLADRIEVPIGERSHVVERTVVSIASRQVPETMFALPRDYRDVTPKPAPAKRKAAR